MLIGKKMLIGRMKRMRRRFGGRKRGRKRVVGWVLGEWVMGLH